MNTLKKIIASTVILGAILVGVSVSPGNLKAIESFPDLQSFYSKILTSSISPTATTINVSSAPNVDTALLVIEPRTVNQEIVYMTSKSGNALTVVRGLGTYGSNLTASTTNRSHPAGSAIEIADVHYYIKLLQDVVLGSTSTPSMIITNATTTNATSTNFATTNFTATNGTTTYLTSTEMYVSSLLEAISAIITTFTADTLTVNTSASLPATTFTGAPTWASDPTNNDHLVRKSYADGLTFAGVASSTENNTGSSRIATKAQASAGTSADSVGNRLVLPASMATSTSQVATTSVVVTNTSGKIDSSFLDGETYSFATTSFTGMASFDGGVDIGFGDGSDGDVTIAGGSTTTLTSNKYYDDLTVNGTLVTNGFKIYVAGTLSGTGKITWGTPNNGGNATDQVPCDNSPTSGAAGGQRSGSGIFKNISGSSGGSGGDYKEDGTAGTAGIHSVPGIGNSGAAGGRGGGGGAGGAAGAVTSPLVKFGNSRFQTCEMVEVTTSIMQITGSGGSGGGGGGRGSSYNSSCAGAGGGGGGASGGIIWIASKIWDGTFTIESVGGNGGNGGDAQGGVDISCPGAGGAGAGGSGGVSVVIYGRKYWSGTYNLAGGKAGTAGVGTDCAVSGSSASNGLPGLYYEIPITQLN